MPPDKYTIKLWHYYRIRWLLAILSVGGLTIILSLTLYQAFTTSLLQGVDDVPFNDLTNESIKNRVEFSRSLFQVGLLLLGALWGTLIAKKDEAKLVFEDRPEVIMFVCASVLLFSSLVCHALYLQNISYVYFIGGRAYMSDSPAIPDVFNPNINNVFSYQISHFIAGIIVATLTLISTHKLKEA